MYMKYDNYYFYLLSIYNQKLQETNANFFTEIYTHNRNSH